jgi:hypothetical protein
MSHADESIGDESPRHKRPRFGMACVFSSRQLVWKTSQEQWSMMLPLMRAFQSPKMTL